MLNLLSQIINWTVVLYSVAIMAGVAVILAVLILVISKYCEVKNDPKVDEVLSKLPNANCGGCGYTGCVGYAKALCEGKADLSQCGQLAVGNKIEISNVLGITVDGLDPTICVVACAGGNACSDKYSYQGFGDCISQNFLAGGRKSCLSGCMGSGSCVDACPYLCVECRDGYAQIDAEVCRSCGLCIKACPKNLIKRVPSKAKYFVACSTDCRGKNVMTKCKVGCISCGLCQKNCPSDAIHLVNNVPIIDYSKCTNCGACADKCPRKCIKLIHKN